MSSAEHRDLVDAPIGSAAVAAATSAASPRASLLGVAIVALRSSLHASARARDPAGAPRSTARARTSSASAASRWLKTAPAALVYLKRVDGVPHVFVSRYVGGHWQAPIRVDTEEPYAASWPRIGAGRTAASSWSCGRRRSRPHNEQPVYELLGATLGPGAPQFGAAIDRRPRHRRRHRHEPRPRDELHRAGRRRLPGRRHRRSASIDHPAAAPRRRRRGACASRTSTASAGRRSGAINRDPGVSMRPPTQANAPQIAIGPTGNGVVVWQEPEIERRRAHLGQAPVRHARSTTCCRSAPTTFSGRADRGRRRRAERRRLAARPGRGRLPPERRARLAAAGAADLPEHPARRRIGQRRGVRGRERRRLRGLRRRRRRRSDRRASTSTKSEDLRLLYDSNGTPRVIEGDDRGLTGALSLGPPFVGRRTAPRRA